MFDNKEIASKDDHGVKIIPIVKVNSGNPSKAILIFSVLFFNLWWLFHFCELAAPGMSVLGWVC